MSLLSCIYLWLLFIINYSMLHLWMNINTCVFDCLYNLIFFLSFFALECVPSVYTYYHHYVSYFDHIRQHYMFTSTIGRTFTSQKILRTSGPVVLSRLLINWHVQHLLRIEYCKCFFVELFIISAEWSW